MTASETDTGGDPALSAAATVGETGVETRRVALFIGFAFAIAWAVAAVIYATGGIGPGSPDVLAGLPLWYVLTATGYMFAPALANVLTRLATGEGRTDLRLRPRVRRNWRWWALAWLVPPVCIALGAALFFLVFPGYFDPSVSALRSGMAAALPADASLPFGPVALVGLQAASALTIGTFITSFFTFGEEFGWRAYLQPKLMPLGGRRAVLIVGVIWGVWHWPVILMGYNYPDAPVLGALAMVLVTVVFGVFLGWVTIHGASVWPAVIGHAAINANASLGLLFVEGTPSSLLGPAPTGVVGLVPFAILAAWLLVRPGALTPSSA